MLKITHYTLVRYYYKVYQTIKIPIQEDELNVTDSEPTVVLLAVFG